MNDSVAERFEGLRKALPCTEMDVRLLVKAFVHRSYLNERAAAGAGFDESNERLEFLGDAVLSCAVSRLLYERFPDADEGTLTGMRSRLVNTRTLAGLSGGLGLGSLLFLGKGEALSGGAENPAILADTLEALIGAVFTGAGYDGALEFIARLFAPLLDRLPESPSHFDHKPRLQELCQRIFKEDPVYRLVSEEGPAHRKVFEVEAVVSGEVRGRGRAFRKKDAEQAAALEALKAIERGRECSKGKG